MASGVYNRFYKELALGTMNLSTDTIRCALVSSGYTFDPDHTVWNSSSGPQANEVSGTGYTAFGSDLSGKSVTQNDTNNNVKWDADDETWTGSTISGARFAILFDDTVTSNPLICAFDFGSNKSSNNGDFSVVWSTAGIMVLSTGS